MLQQIFSNELSLANFFVFRWVWLDIDWLRLSRIGRHKSEKIRGIRIFGVISSGLKKSLDKEQ